MWLLYALASINLACLVHLWWRPGVPLAQRITWTLLLCLSMVGPLAYGSAFKLPPARGKTDYGSHEEPMDMGPGGDFQ